MPLTDLDPNVSSNGRNSRSSMSTSSVAFKGGRSRSGSGKADFLGHNPSVLAMLRTTTEIGDVGGLSAISNRLPKQRGPSRRPSGNNLSRTSSHYSQTASIRSKVSNRSLTEQSIPSVPGSWPNSHRANIGHQESLQGRRTQSRAPSGPNHPRSLSHGATDYLNADQHRSNSLTTTHSSIHPLHYQRSATSLRSHDYAPQRRSPPKKYPPRFRRPGYRPGSPALSDSLAPSQQGIRMMRPGSGPRAYSTSPNPYHLQRKAGYQDSHPTTALRFYQSLEDFEGPLAAPSRPRDSMLPFEPRPLNWVNTSAPGFANPAGYNRPAQPFLTTPSPLREGYSRFDRAIVATKPPMPAEARTGFVQRVKNLLEERAMSESLQSSTYSGPKTQFDGRDRIAVRSVSSQLHGSPITLSSTAAEPEEKPIASSNAKAPDEAFYELAGEQSSGDGSSFQADESLDLSRSVSTPDVRNMKTDGQSDVYTKDSSNDSPIAAVNVSLQTAIRKAMAPTISEASHSATDLLDVTSIGATSPDRIITRPFSFPLTSTSNESTSVSIRQSLPTATNLPTTDMIKFSFPNKCVVEPTEQSELEQYSVAGTLAKTEVLPQDSGVVLPSYANDAFPPCLKVQTPASPDMQTDTNRVLVSMHTFTPTRPQSDSATYMLDNLPRAQNGELGPILRKRARAGSAPLTSFDNPSWTSASIAIRQSYAPEEEDQRQPVSAFSVPARGNSSNRPRQTADAAANSSVRRLPNREPALRGSMIPDENRSSIPSRTASDASDIRISNTKHFSFALPDLTEDSQEDASTTNLRMLGSRPHPFRSSGPRGPREMKGRSRLSAAPAEPPSSYLPRKKLKDTKGIPSFTFSSIDLTATLNRALGFRSSKSVEDLKSIAPRRGSSARNTRVFASDDINFGTRQRYRSFFREAAELPAKEVNADVTQQTVPDELLAEIDRISIPSVNGLTIRLSELIPSLQKSSSQPDITNDEQALAHTIEEIRDVGSVTRLGSIDIKRASRISSVSATQIGQQGTLIDANHNLGDRTPSRLALLLLNKELPPLPSGVTSPSLSIASGATRTGQPSGLDPCNIVAELEGTVPIMFASGSQAGTVRELCSSSIEDLERTRSTVAKLNSTPKPSGVGREDHIASQPSLDIAMTVSTVGRSAGSPAPRLASRLKQSGSIYSDGDVRIARSMSPGLRFDASLVPESKASISFEKDTVTKKGPIGSLIRKMGIRPRIDKAGFPIDPEFLHPEERATEPGDRYPTTGLTPPAGLNIEDNRSFFSDDSSEREQPRVGSLRKRLTRVRQKRFPSRTISLNETSSEILKPPSATGHDGSIFGGSQLETTNTDAVFMMFDEPPLGMSRMEFRAKKVVERLRSLWFRSGRLIRGIAHHKKQAPSWYEGSEVYSGT